MKIYFLSSLPCALTFNDVYFGVTDKFERFADISLKDNIFVRFAPQNAQPLGFFLNENIRFIPPEGCEVYLLQDALAIYARDFPPQDLTLKIITQQRFQDNLVTVFQQGALQISIESAFGLFISTLPPSFASCELSFHADLFFLKCEKHLAIYTKKGECVFMEQILRFSVEENTLNATLPLSDLFSRTAECSYALTENGCYRTKCTIMQHRLIKDDETETQVRQRLENELLPYAFFESVLIGANYAEMLSDELAPDADKIKAYLGDFTAITLTKEPNVCGLVKKRAERLYEVEYYKVETENGKISDVKG